MKTHKIHLLLGVSLVTVPTLLVMNHGRAENGVPGYDCSMHHNGYLMHKKPGCMSGGVSAIVSKIESPSQTNIGFYSPSPGMYYSVASNSDWITRYGFETEFERTIEGFNWAPNGFTTSFYVSSKFIWTRDESRFSGSMANNGSSSVGFIYNSNYMSNSYVFSNTSNVVASAYGNTTNAWHVGSAGFGVNIIPDEERPNHSIALEVRPFFERFSLDSSGQGQLTQNGSLYNNTWQTYNLETSDNYYGTSFEARAYVTPHWCDFVVFDFGAHAEVAYHEGKGNFWQVTNQASTQVSQSQSFRNNGVTLGGGVTGGVTVKVPESAGLGRWVIRAEIDYSVLPEVTGHHNRSNPSGAAGGFTSEDLERITGMVGARIQF